MENNEVIKKRISFSKIAIIIIVLILSSVILTLFYNLKKKEDIINNYKQQISVYLKEKYNEDFDIVYIKKGYKQIHYGGGGGCPGYSVTDKNTEEYEFFFSPKNVLKNMRCRILYWYNTQNNTYEICEETDEDYPYTYAEIVAFHNHKLEIKDSLNSYLESHLGKQYTIDWLYEANTIEVLTSIPLEKIVLEDFNKFTNMFNNIVNLLTDKNIIVIIINTDTLKSIYITEESKVENESTVNGIISSSQKPDLRNSLEYYLKNGLENGYTVDWESSALTILVKTKKPIEEIVLRDVNKFENMFNNIAKLLEGKKTTVEIAYPDKYSSIRITANSTMESSGAGIIASKQKIEIKELLDNYLKQYLGSEYTIDWFYAFNIILVKTKRPIREVVLKDSQQFTNMYNNIVELLEDKELTIKLQYPNDLESIDINVRSNIESDYILKKYL